MDEVTRRAIDAAFTERVTDMFQKLCLAFHSGRGREDALNEFRAGLKAAQEAREVVLAG